MSYSEILVNQVFSGSYLEESANIGHEVINLFKADEGCSFLNIPKNQNIGNHDIRYVFFVTHIKNRKTVEILAVASQLSEPTEDELAGMRYGGASMSQIFRDIPPDDLRSLHAFVPYKADWVAVPRHPVFLTVDDSFKLPETPAAGTADAELIRLETKQDITNTSLRKYYSEEADGEVYKQLKLLAEQDIWSEVKDKVVANGASRSAGTSFLEAIRKEDDELVFSNLLAYFFEYDGELLRNFCREVLHINGMDSVICVKREFRDIDIWIESERHTIIIENKIKSGINGIVSIENNKGESQLTKYRRIAEEETPDKDRKFFLLVPDYNNINVSLYDSAPTPEDEYSVLRYSNVLDFFVRHAPAYIADRCFPDFIRGLERHAVKSLPEFRLKTMKSRFMRRIAQVR